MASAARTLICRNCRTEAPLRPQHACYDCFGPLEINYDLDVLRNIKIGRASCRERV